MDIQQGTLQKNSVYSTSTLSIFLLICSKDLLVDYIAILYCLHLGVYVLFLQPLQVYFFIKWKIYKSPTTAHWIWNMFIFAILCENAPKLGNFFSKSRQTGKIVIYRYHVSRKWWIEKSFSLSIHVILVFYVFSH